MKKFYVEKLKLTSDKVFGKNKMKKIKEGGKYSCVCTGSVGAWTGSYNSKEEIANAIEKWCASETGSCIPLE
jgi:hypothetical protein